MKTRRIKHLIRRSIFLIIMFLGIIMGLYGLTKMQFNITNQELVKFLIGSSSNYINTDFNLTKKVTNFFSGFDLNDPVTMLNKNFVIKQDHINDLIKETSYIMDPKYAVNNNGVVYIFNSNQLETYKDNSKIIKPNVLMSAYYLRDQLQNLNISAYVENTDFTTSQLNYNRNDFYKLLGDIVKAKTEKNDKLVLLIDLGRQLASYNKTTITKDNQAYATFQFLSTDTNKENIALAQNLNERLNATINGISKGIIYKNDFTISNQNISDKMLIIKCGGKDNSLTEIKNSLNYFAQVINNYLEATYGKI